MSKSTVESIAKSLDSAVSALESELKTETRPYVVTALKTYRGIVAKVALQVRALLES